MNPSFATAHLEQIAASSATIASLASLIIGSTREDETKAVASRIRYQCQHIQDDVEFTSALLPPRNSVMN